MDSENDWDLGAVVRGCSNLNGNSGSQDAHEHFNDGSFPSQTYDSIPQLSEKSHDPGSGFPNLVTPRRYFGLEEVVDRFTNGKKREQVLDPQGTLTPPALYPEQPNGSGEMGKDTPAPQIANPSPTLNPEQPDGSGEMGKDTPAPQSANPSPTLNPEQPLIPSPQTGSPENGGRLEDEKPPRQVKDVNMVEVPAEKVDEWDGWAWRKYGKKAMCDSPHSKSYYRCSHEVNKCPAKKHVQLSNKDESKYVITYKGKHNHPPPAQNTTTKHRKRNRRPPIPPCAAKKERSFSTPTTNNAT